MAPHSLLLRPLAFRLLPRLYSTSTSTSTSDLSPSALSSTPPPPSSQHDEKILDSEPPLTPDLSTLSPPPYFLSLPPGQARVRGIYRELALILRRGSDGQDGSLPCPANDVGVDEGGWRLVEDGRVLERHWTFRRFRDAWAFLSAVAGLAKDYTRGNESPPPILYSNGRFALVRWTSRPPGGPSEFPGPVKGEMSAAPSESEMDSRHNGLTRSNVRQALRTSLLAQTFSPVGIGQENATWWRDGGRAKVHAESQRLLELSRETELRARSLLQKRRLQQTDRMPDKRVNSDTIAAADESELFKAEFASDIQDLEVESGNEAGGYADALFDKEQEQEEEEEDMEAVARRELDHRMADSFGVNWVGKAQGTERRRRRVIRGSSQKPTRPWDGKGAE